MVSAVLSTYWLKIYLFARLIMSVWVKMKKCKPDKSIRRKFSWIVIYKIAIIGSVILIRSYSA
jgi:hypothetical protein